VNGNISLCATFVIRPFISREKERQIVILLSQKLAGFSYERARKNTPRNLFLYVFRQQGRLLISSILLCVISFIFHNMPFIS